MVMHVCPPLFLMNDYSRHLIQSIGKVSKSHVTCLHAVDWKPRVKFVLFVLQWQQGMYQKLQDDMIVEPKRSNKKAIFFFVIIFVHFVS